MEDTSSSYHSLKSLSNVGTSCLDIICAIKDMNRENILGILSRCTFDLNKPWDNAGTTLLHTAAKWEDLELSKALLMKEANMSTKNSLGETPLHIVAMQQLRGYDENRTHEGSQRYEVIRLMLHYNADIHMKDSSNKTLKDIFMENIDDRFKTLILTNEANTFKLCEAVMADDISELCEVLHEKDQLGYTNFNVNGCLHQVPLNDAVVQRDYDKCKMLIDCNADVNKMLEYRTPLNLAEEIGNFPIARLLVKKRKQDKSLYKNPLHIAVKECDYHLCEFHLKSISVNSVDEKDRTALHVAVMHAPDELCELLIKNGADVFARDIFSDTPIQLAFYLGRHELREFALSYFSNEIC